MSSTRWSWVPVRINRFKNMSSMSPVRLRRMRGKGDDHSRSGDSIHHIFFTEGSTHCFCPPSEPFPRSNEPLCVVPLFGSCGTAFHNSECQRRHVRIQSRQFRQQLSVFADHGSPFCCSWRFFGFVLPSYQGRFVRITPGTSPAQPGTPPQGTLRTSATTTPYPHQYLSDAQPRTNSALIRQPRPAGHPGEWRAVTQSRETKQTAGRTVHTPRTLARCPPSCFIPLVS